MPRFAANLSTMFTDRPFLERFAAARKAGFQAVECQFPYEAEAADLRAELTANGLAMLLINTPAGDFAAGTLEIGIGYVEFGAQAPGLGSGGGDAGSAVGLVLFEPRQGLTPRGEHFLAAAHFLLRDEAALGDGTGAGEILARGADQRLLLAQLTLRLGEPGAVGAGLRLERRNAALSLPSHTGRAAGKRLGLARDGGGAFGLQHLALAAGGNVNAQQRLAGAGINAIALKEGR